MADTAPNSLNPATVAGRRHAYILQKLKLQHAAVNASAAVLILGAVPLLLLGPLFVAALFWIVTLIWSSDFGITHVWPYSWFVAGAMILMLPSMFLGERRQRGGFFAGGTPDVAPGGLKGARLSAIPVGQYGMLINFAINPRLAASGFVEVILLGPRLMLDGLTKLHRSGRLKGVSFDRAADMAVRLASVDSNVPVASLMIEGEPVEPFVRALCLLIFHDWIGISQSGDRAWLLSQARKGLPGGQNQ